MKKNIFKKIIYVTIVLGLTGLVAFVIYASSYYKADENVSRLIKTEQIVVENDSIKLIPKIHQKNIGIIFYPGAKVEYTSYLPMLNKLKENGYTVISLKMPFNMAIFGKNKANEIYDNHPNIKHWYIAGHSMGGAMASSYASAHQDKIEGLILLGAYPYGDYPLNKTLTIYGTLNTSVAEKINYTENVVKIDGGNHAQFGNYGKQKGDAEAHISPEEQQNETVSTIIDFIKNNRQNIY
ncbi:alpha/beta fold hydrolase [Gemella cuniculi]|uniref:alpha/beta fold hydrolase n=1 Tax=Gemella cuniculi TaxID=150240 RepID=UPI00040D7E1C|nr:alpha/beta fold hydrolase [Gemella cuniculi]